MNLTKLNTSWKTIKIYNQLDGISEHDILIAIQDATPVTTVQSKLHLPITALIILILQVVCCQGI